MIKKILLTVTVLMLFGCVKDLKESERAWNPYIVSQVLVFESSNNEIDTIAISEIIDNAVSDGPTPKFYYSKHLIVYGERLREKGSAFSKKSVLGISAGNPNKPTDIGFPLYFENAKFAGWGLELKELEKYPLLSLSTKAGTFNDIIKLESVWYHPEREDEVQFMYWSKKHGYIKFERADGFTWELVDKYIPK